MNIRRLLLLILTPAAVVHAANRDHAVQEPDYLIPVDPYSGIYLDSYTKRLRSGLKLDSPFFIQMVVRPAFTGEFALGLHGRKREYDIDSTDELFLTSSVASTSFWYSLPENNEEKSQKRVSVTETTVPFPKPLAIRLHRIWKRMLLRTRYPQESRNVMDSTTFEFSAVTSINPPYVMSPHGEVSSPVQRKSPELLVELGMSLFGYCHSTPANRAAGEKEIEKRAARLERYLAWHPFR